MTSLYVLGYDRLSNSCVLRDFWREVEYALRACVLCADHEKGRLRWRLENVMVRDAWPRIHPRGLADTYLCISTYTRRRKTRTMKRVLFLCETCKSKRPLAIASIARSPLLTSFFFFPTFPLRLSFFLFSPEILYRQFLSLWSSDKFIFNILTS